MRSALLALGIVALTLGLVACGSKSASPTAAGGSASAGDIVVSGAWTRPVMASMSMPGMTMPSGTPMATHTDMNITDAVYFTIKNNGKSADQLLSASSDAATSTEMHQSTLANGISSMKPVSVVDVPAGGSVSFDPGNYHVMLVGLQHDLNVGDHFDLTLTFKQAGAVKVSVEVRPN